MITKLIIWLSQIAERYADYVIRHGGDRDLANKMKAEAQEARKQAITRAQGRQFRG